MEEEIDLRELFKNLWSKKLIIIIVTLIFALLGIVYTKFLLVYKYDASTLLVVVETKFETEADIQAYARLVDTYSVVAKSETVMNKVIENLKLDVKEEVDREKFKDNLLISTSGTSQSLRITIENTDPEAAANIANEYAKVLIEELKRIYNENRIQVIDIAVASNEPINVELVKNTVVTACIGMVISCAYVLVKFLFKDEKDTKKEEK